MGLMLQLIDRWSGPWRRLPETPFLLAYVSRIKSFLLTLSSLRGQKQLKAATESHGDHPDGGSPFGPRPSSSRSNSVAIRSLERAMDELDDEQHMPEGVESAVWQRLVQTRREKVESEQQVNWLLLFPRGRNIEYRLQIEYRIWLVHNVLGIFLSSDLSHDDIVMGFLWSFRARKELCPL